MWVFLPITSLLIRAVVGNSEIEKNPVEVNPKFQDATDEIKTPSIDMSKTWDESFLEKGKELDNLYSANIKEEDSHGDVEKDRDPKFVGVSELRAKIVKKRSETASAGSWLYLPSKERVSSIAASSDLSQEKKSPAFNPWGGKRIALYKMGPNIRRPIRVPFNSWGGKRNGAYDSAGAEQQAKRNRFLVDRLGPRILVEGLEIKRVPEIGKSGWKVPFNSWGGKRSQELTDIERRKLMLMAENDVGREESAFATGDLEEPIDEKRSSKSGSGKTRARFNSWGGKRAEDPEDAGLDNEGAYDYEDEEDKRRSLTKRSNQGLQKKVRFNSWGGKRDTRARTFLLDKDYDLPKELIEEGKSFYPWSG
ncbi:hypothetical protein KM043_006343 [Ampulex compressa]|nr:hypothetical protein KM043_006343 [Ampulex compressa]